MKNLYIFIILLCFVQVSAQDTETTAPKSKSNAEILPAAGDIAIGADALPYLNYLGNMLSSAGTNTLNLGSNNLYIRYHLTANTAVRAIISIVSVNDIQKYYVTDDAALFADPLSQAKVEDKVTTSTNMYTLNVGYVMSRGYDRLRGFYGAQINYGFGRYTKTYQYGNNFTAANSSPSTHFGKLSERTLETDFDPVSGMGGLMQHFGLGLIAGVEYYFLPKICIGGEVCLDYSYSWGSQSNEKREKLVGNNVIEINKLVSPGNKTSVLTTTRPATYGGLYLMFHF